MTRQWITLCLLLLSYQGIKANTLRQLLSVVTDVRLDQPTSDYDNYGRVEVYIGSTWYTLCAHEFSEMDANVVCRQLGEDNGRVLADYDRGPESMNAESPICSGDESSLTDCQWASSSCDVTAAGTPAAAVFCSYDEDLVCDENGDVRIVGWPGVYSDEYHGRVEVCYLGSWGSVCDDSFDDDSASVVCRQMRYHTGTDIQSFAGGTGIIAMDDVECEGTEAAIDECPHNGWGSHNCDHDEDVGVDCIGADYCGDGGYEGDLRLVPAENQHDGTLTQGRLEICQEAEWGTICNEGFDDNDAMVACKQMGYATGEVLTQIGGGGGTVWRRGVDCEGDEARLRDCPYTDSGENQCSHQRDVWISCEGVDLACLQRHEGHVRLVDGLGNDGHRSGRLEICHNLEWGTVCDDDFDEEDANVICDQLGLGGGSAKVVREFGKDSGRGRGIIWLDDVACDDSESEELVDCGHGGWEISNCHHHEDVGVLCIPAQMEGQLRLIPAKTPASGELDEPDSGRLEIFRNDAWGTFCAYNFVSMGAEADAICRELGFSRATDVRKFTSGTGTIYHFEDDCVSSDTFASECVADEADPVSLCDTHDEDTGIACANDMGQFRLVGGTSRYSGRVEIFDGAVWGTVCDDGFGEAEAKAICRDLNFGDMYARPTKMFGEGTGPIFLSEVSCPDTTTSFLESCTFDGFPACLHTEDIGIICSEKRFSEANEEAIDEEGLLRLVSVSDEQAKRVEIFHDGIWGTICDDEFSEVDAKVVCSNFGYNAGNVVRVGGGTGPIWMDDVDCSGTEASFSSCQFSGWAVHNCEHGEDVGVECYMDTSDCDVNDALRLVGSNDVTSEGRLEVCHENKWGTICEDEFSDVDAEVACKQLGYFTGHLDSHKRYGAGTGSIHMDNVECSGDEASLTECTSNGWGVNNCEHVEDVSVICKTEEDVVCSTEGNTRLTENGIVQVCHEDRWGTICGAYIREENLAVICGSLGFDSGVRLEGITGETGPIWMDDVWCDGSEASVTDCSFQGWGDHNCEHSSDVAVTCYNDADLACDVEGAIRIVGEKSNEGRLEICHDYRWGTICESNFFDESADVACRQLGFHHGTAVRYGGGLGKIWMDNVMCGEGDSALADCLFGGWDHTSRSCNHTRDVGVICEMEVDNSCPAEMSVRMTGDDGLSGRVDICHSGEWGVICDDDVTVEVAQVLCRQMGFTGGELLQESSSESSTESQSSEEEDVTILLDGVQCVGTEGSISDCTLAEWGSHDCSVNEALRITCEYNADLACHLDGELRLTGGDEQTGRVEVCHATDHGALYWGTICEDNFDDSDATVICKQLGFVRGFIEEDVDPGEGIIWMDELACLGTEDNVGECAFSGWGAHDCEHSKDIGVHCDYGEDSLCSTEYEIRLVNDAEDAGTYPGEGRVEICHDNQFGTICDDLFDADDATVICRGFGYESGRVTEKYGGGIGIIWMSGVACVGDEATFSECAFHGWRDEDCSHLEDVGIFCENPCQNEDEIRLVDSEGEDSNTIGRLEICHDGRWGTVCSDNFGQDEADIACQQLDQSTGEVLAADDEQYGEDGVGDIWMDEVSCSPGLSQLADCDIPDWGQHDCDHTRDVRLSCEFLTCDGTTDDIRVVGEGEDSPIGRVEICMNDEWGTICDDDFNENAANIICLDRGFGSGVVIPEYGGGVGRILLDDVNCASTEVVGGIRNCDHAGVGVHNCDHSEDVGVECMGAPCDVELALQLVGGVDDTEGRVEICKDGTWGTVCGAGINDEAADVICRELNYDFGIMADAGTFGPGTGQIWMKDVDCPYNKEALSECEFSGWYSEPDLSCTHQQDVGVQCFDALACTLNWSFQLTGGTTASQGRLEVCYQQKWGTICNDGFAELEAEVACNTLGFHGGVLSSGAPGVGPIHLSDFTCPNNVVALTGCPRSGWGDNECTHGEDVWLECYDCEEGEIRLSGEGEGRVEICHNGVFGTVCSEGFDNADADVVCQELGFQAGSVMEGTPAGSDQIWMSNVQCVYEKEALVDCVFDGWGETGSCDHSQDAGVVCNDFVCNSGLIQLRLADGANAAEGRLETCAWNQWGTICDDGFDDVAVTVACKQLGYDFGGIMRDDLPTGTGKIWMDEMRCRPTDATMWACPFAPWGATDCQHSEDVRLQCFATESCGEDYTLRLEDSSNNNAGRVEICYQRDWGTFCDAGFDNEEARVICEQLGYDSGMIWESFADGTGTVWMSDITCDGTNTAIHECPFNGWGANTCEHSRDVGLLCGGPPCVDGSARLQLVGGLSTADGEPYSGRVEFCTNIGSGAICKDEFTVETARVICRDLDFYSGAMADFEAGTGVLFDNLLCVGDEADFTACPATVALADGFTCTDGTHAGVLCDWDENLLCSTENEVRLGDASGDTGRVEICHNKQWGTVCSGSFGNNAANAVCLALGYDYGATATWVSGGTGPIWYTDVTCPTNAYDIAGCTLTQNIAYTCAHTADVWVVCSYDSESFFMY